jgi:long-subunit fatty acid transport protein
LDYVDSEQTGSGFAPIFGLYLTPMEGFDIGIRYEGKTTLELTNETKVDGSGLFPDGAKTNADMPAMLGVGIGYKAMPSLRIVADFNYYFNKDVNWDGKEKFLENGTEIGVGFDFAVSDALRLSAGYLNSMGGSLKGYSTDLSYTLNANTIGAGGRYYINPNLYISLGVGYTTYKVYENDGVKYYSGTELLTTGNETYDKSTLDFAIGIGFSR